MVNSSNKLGLMGNPISHSKSPALFKAAYKETNYTYSLIEAPTAQIAFNKFIDEGFIGANVTSPFKDDIMQYVDAPSEISKFLKSANTIILKDGKIHSYITDYYGVKNTISDYIQSTGKISSALIIGSGGAGKAASLATKHLGLKTFIANRSINKGIEFAESLNSFTGGQKSEFISLEDIEHTVKECNLIIYTLSMLIPQMENLNIKNHIMFEANYAHPFFDKTECIKYLSGKYWLYNQAIPAFKLFTSKEPDNRAMWEVL